MLRLNFVKAEDICEVAKQFPEIEKITYIGKTDESDYDDCEDIWAWFDVQTTGAADVALNHKLNVALFPKIDYSDISLVNFVFNSNLAKYPQTLQIYSKF